MHMVQTLYTGLFHITEKPRTSSKGNKALFVMASLDHSKCKDSYWFLWEKELTTIAVFPCPVLENFHGSHLKGFVMSHKMQV